MREFVINRRHLMVGGALLATGCGVSSGGEESDDAAPSEAFPVVSFDGGLDGIVAQDAVATVVASGFEWTEGPTWDAKRSMLYFSDIPNNRVHSWDAENGLGLWRAEGGSIPAPEGVQAGTNGLLYLADEDAVLVCDQSSRSVIKYDLANGGEPTVVARGPEDLPFNSPNDVVRDAQGGVYFTDPSYGLAEGIESPVRARSFNGVYYAPADGSDIQLVDDGLTFPNGIALSPDEAHLYVAVSDQAAPRIVRYAREGDGWQRESDPWFDMMPLSEGGLPGSADGMAVAQDGTVFATAPGGMVILSPDAALLGQVTTGRATGNCCFGEDGKTIFITSDDVLVRMPVLVSGLGF